MERDRGGPGRVDTRVRRGSTRQFSTPVLRSQSSVGPTVERGERSVRRESGVKGVGVLISFGRKERKGRSGKVPSVLRVSVVSHTLTGTEVLTESSKRVPRLKASSVRGTRASTLWGRSPGPSWRTRCRVCRLDGRVGPAVHRIRDDRNEFFRRRPAPHVAPSTWLWQTDPRTSFPRLTKPTSHYGRCDIRSPVRHSATVHSG